MSTVREHYDQHLAAHYSWLFGEFEARVAAERAWFDSRGIVPRGSGVAVDLGAGSGVQSPVRRVRSANGICHRRRNLVAGLSAATGLPAYFAAATFFSASAIASGAQRMFMKLFDPIILRSGKLMAMRKRPYNA